MHGLSRLIVLVLCSTSCVLATSRDERHYRIRRQDGPRKGTPEGRAAEDKTPEVKVPVVTVPLFESRLYEYGTAQGDHELPAETESAVRLALTNPISFFGKEHNVVYVLSNGGIGFQEAVKQYRPEIFKDEFPMMAPYWLPCDLRKGGKVYYREVTQGPVLVRGRSEVEYHYGLRVIPKSALVVTWLDQQPRRNDILPGEKRNTVQAVILVTNNGTFANFIYSKIEWGKFAQGGFNRGEGWIQYYKLPGLGTTFLKVRGNTGIPGEWMFQIDGKDIIRCRTGIKGDLCDTPCDPGQWGNDCQFACSCEACDNTNGQCPAPSDKATTPKA